MVEEEDHHAIAQLRDTVRQSDGDQAAVDGALRPEAHQMEGGVLAEEVGDVNDAGQQLAQACGEGGAPCAPVQHKDGHIVQYAVGEAADAHRENGQHGPPVGLDQDLQIIRHDEADGKGSQPPQIRHGVAQRFLLRPQQQGKGLQKDQHQSGDGQADDRQQHQILGEQAVGVFPVALPQIDGEDGAGSDGEGDGDGEHDVGEGDSQIHRRHGVVPYTLGHEQAVHDGVQGKNHEGGHGGRGEA